MTETDGKKAAPLSTLSKSAGAYNRSPRRRPGCRPRSRLSQNRLNDIKKAIAELAPDSDDESDSEFDVNNCAWNWNVSSSPSPSSLNNNNNNNNNNGGNDAVAKGGGLFDALGDASKNITTKSRYQRRRSSNINIGAIRKVQSIESNMKNNISSSNSVDSMGSMNRNSRIGDSPSGQRKSRGKVRLSSTMIGTLSKELARPSSNSTRNDTWRLRRSNERQDSIRSILGSSRSSLTSGSTSTTTISSSSDLQALQRRFRRNFPNETAMPSEEVLKKLYDKDRHHEAIEQKMEPDKNNDEVLEDRSGDELETNILGNEVDSKPAPSPQQDTQNAVNASKVDEHEEEAGISDDGLSFASETEYKSWRQTVKRLNSEVDVFTNYKDDDRDQNDDHHEHHEGKDTGDHGEEDNASLHLGDKSDPRARTKNNDISSVPQEILEVEKKRKSTPSLDALNIGEHETGKSKSMSVSSMSRTSLSSKQSRPRHTSGSRSVSSLTNDSVRTRSSQNSRTPPRTSLDLTGRTQVRSGNSLKNSDLAKTRAGTRSSTSAQRRGSLTSSSDRRPRSVSPTSYTPASPHASSQRPASRSSQKSLDPANTHQRTRSSSISRRRGSMNSCSPLSRTRSTSPSRSRRSSHRSPDPTKTESRSSRRRLKSDASGFERKMAALKDDRPNDQDEPSIGGSNSSGLAETYKTRSKASKVSSKSASRRGSRTASDNSASLSGAYMNAMLHDSCKTMPDFSVSSSGHSSTRSNSLMASSSSLKFNGSLSSFDEDRVTTSKHQRRKAKSRQNFDKERRSLSNNVESGCSPTKEDDERKPKSLPTLLTDWDQDFNEGVQTPTFRDQMHSSYNEPSRLKGDKNTKSTNGGALKREKNESKKGNHRKPKYLQSVLTEENSVTLDSEDPDFNKEVQILTFRDQSHMSSNSVGSGTKSQKSASSTNSTALKKEKKKKKAKRRSKIEETNEKNPEKSDLGSNSSSNTISNGKEVAKEPSKNIPLSKKYPKKKTRRGSSASYALEDIVAEYKTSRSKNSAREDSKPSDVPAEDSNLNYDGNIPMAETFTPNASSSSIQGGGFELNLHDMELVSPLTVPPKSARLSRRRR
eukprot:CAMPEP_0172386146 /NCGR_PEP_ID=MMETSP1061-20121228/3736_1 /TAXON_ID=37318 /ORGANISM="Pseudo-nitzschia pungens, Strain cf. pungens" /LENGTH=1096 /DNA_ID=CAMNT_0013115431 /DNA_START=335 /DNA_END=3625 /DNA_ORIENTATION=-